MKVKKRNQENGLPHFTSLTGRKAPLSEPSSLDKAFSPRVGRLLLLSDFAAP